MNNNMDMNEVLKMISKMDKKQLEEGLSKVSKILNSPDADKLINKIKESNS